MANQRRSRRAGPRPQDNSAETLRDSVFHLTSEMEEPLRHALQMIRLIGLMEAKDDEDREAIGYVAHEAAVKLGTVSDRLRELFAACAQP